MRQIDNMTPQEIETLHLKNMLAPGMQPRRVTYDKQCLDLARSFMSDTTETPAHQETLAVILASEIQQAIEDFMEERGLST